MDFSKLLTKRRTFLQGVLAASALGIVPLPCTVAVARAVEEMDSCVWCACVINCGQRCPVKCYVRDGRVVATGTDEDGEDDPRRRQLRPCLCRFPNRSRAFAAIFCWR